MTTMLKNVSSKARGDLKREESREFTAEEMKSPDVQRALRHGILVEVPKESVRVFKA
jgi:hypothetical protein